MKKALMSILAVVMMLTVCFSQGFAKEKFPTKPIKVVVPYAAGGGVDIIARVLEKVMPKYLPNNQSIVIINNAAGSNVAGTTEVYQATPDGYTIGFFAAAPLSITPLYGQTPYTHDSFQAICRIVSVPQLFVVRKDAPWNTIEEWLDWVKQNPDQFVYGSAGVSSAGNLSIQPLIVGAGIKVKHIPFNGGAPAIAALLGGHIQGMASAANELKTQIESEKFKILLNLGTIKASFYKKVPLITEKGFQTVGNTYYGMVGPKGMPKEVVSVLQRSFKKAVGDPLFKKYLADNGLPSAFTGPEEFQKEITDSFNKNGKVLRDLGIIK